MKFRMPENLDISYKFFGGRWSFKDIGIRLIGLPVGIVIGFILYLLTSNIIIVGIGASIPTLAGWYIASKKVFNKTMPYLTARNYKTKLDRKTKVLYNQRRYEAGHIRTAGAIEKIMDLITG